MPNQPLDVATPLLGLDEASGPPLVAHLVNMLRSRAATGRFVREDGYPSSTTREYVMISANCLEMAFRHGSHDERVREAVRYLAAINPAGTTTATT